MLPAGPKSLAALLAAVCSSVPTFAQSSLRVERVKSPLRNAGIFDPTTGTWTRNVDTNAALGTKVLFNNNAPSGYYNPQDPNHGQFGEGRIPSTDSEGNSECYTVDCFQVAYCTDEFASLGVTAAWYEFYESCTAPATAPTATYNGSVSSLPGTPVIGTQACWITTIDLGGFSIVGDNDGVFDNVVDEEELDGFGWSVRVIGLTPGSASTGLCIAGDPNNAPFGAGTDPLWGFAAGPNGTGLGERDQFFIDDQTNNSLDGCFWFGGYPNNSIWGAHWHRLLGDKGDCSSDPCLNVPDDGFEQNDVCSAAALLFSDGQNPHQLVRDGDEDWYRVLLDPGERLWVNLPHTRVCDIDLEIYSSCGSLTSSDLDDYGFPALSIANTTPFLQGASVRVFVDQPAQCCQFYTLDVTRQQSFCDDCSVGDPLEPNDDCSAAVALSPGEYPSLSVQGSDPDWYSVQVPPGDTLDAYALFFHDAGDIQMELLDSCGSVIGESKTNDHQESLTYQNLTAQAEELFVQVYVEGAASVCNCYELNISLDSGDPIGGGGVYCVSSPTSNGVSAISASDLTISIAANNLVLSADNLPTGPPQPGIFIAGPDPAAIPFFDGVLCIAPDGLQRLKPVLFPSGAARTVALAVDLGSQAQTPGGGCAPLNVAAGTPYRFQYWTRDPAAGGANANFSSAIAIDFVP